MKVWLFRAIAVLIPVIFFVLLEVGLRLFGFGQSMPLFIPTPNQPDYLLPRPDLVNRYFADPQQAPSVSIEANFFRAEKPVNGLRFFVQGGSTAAGFPYGLGASLAGMLDHRLRRSFANHYVETVNTALAAVNSYTMLDMAEEIIAQQPDGIFIYMGHNEYLGLLGVGSNYTAADSRATTLLFLKLKQLRVFQLIQSVYQRWFFTRPAVTSQEQARTMMAKVAKHKSIPLDSELFQAGIEQFEGNLALLLSTYQQAGIPVFIGTLTSNLLDQPPFASAPVPPALAQQLTSAAHAVSAQQADLNQLAALSSALQDQPIATAHFQLGRIFYALGQYQPAQQHLTLAREHDLLRFRAPQIFNRIIHAQALKYGATVVAAQQRFAQRSPQGLVGNNLMLEHLHPNVGGYFLLSDAFYQTIINASEYSPTAAVPANQAWRQRLLLPSEEYYGFAKIQQLKTDYPFSATPHPLSLPAPQDWQQHLGKAMFSKQIDWLAMVKSAQSGYQRQAQSEMALKTQLMLADAMPFDAPLNLAAAELLIAADDKLMARHYLQRLRWNDNLSAVQAKQLTTLQQQLSQ